MSKFSLRLKELRASRGMSQQDLADIIEMSKSSVNMYERGEREPGIETLEALADFFDVDIDYLLGKTNTPNKMLDPIDTAVLPRYDNILPISTQKIRLLGDIACGKPIFADEDRESYVVTGTGIKADFALRCKGDSMINARIHDGDIVFIRQQPTVENGEIAAVIIDDETTLKRVMYYPEKSLLILKPENPKYDDMVYQGEELNTIRILGKAIAFQSDIH